MAEAQAEVYEVDTILGTAKVLCVRMDGLDTLTVECGPDSRGRTMLTTVCRFNPDTAPKPEPVDDEIDGDGREWDEDYDDADDGA